MNPNRFSRLTFPRLRLAAEKWKAKIGLPTALRFRGYQMKNKNKNKEA
jgi:hypothetical protein